MTAPSPSSQPDAQLFARSRNGDRAAFATLLDRHAPALLRYIRRFGATVDDAEDILQETLYRLLRDAHRYDPNRSLRGWMFGIARILCLESLRDGRRELTMAEPPALPASAENKDAAHVRAVLSGLDADARELLHLRFFQELTYEEIAAALNLHEAAVRRRLVKLLEQLRGLLA